jgi:hypothetical protein
MKPSPTPESQLNAFIAEYSPEIAAQAHAVLKKMRKLVPGAIELVYDNYNALVIGFGPTERASDAIFSIALYPRWINLFFFPGFNLADPAGLLKGSGTAVRRIQLEGPDTLDRPEVRALIKEALASAETPINRKAKGRLVIKSISARQRPRRPSK